jgi:hypothetical protein
MAPKQRGGTMRRSAERPQSRSSEPPAGVELLRFAAAGERQEVAHGPHWPLRGHDQHDLVDDAAATPHAAGHFRALHGGAAPNVLQEFADTRLRESQRHPRRRSSRRRRRHEVSGRMRRLAAPFASGVRGRESLPRRFENPLQIAFLHGSPYPW